MTDPDAAPPTLVEAAAAPDSSASAAVVDPASASAGFQVRLANFTGPFDLLLQLIGKHKLDVTEVALHTVTDDFIAYIRAMGDDWDLDEASEFLVVAATLLDLKAARLLPSATVENEEDLALLEARDLLFARLLQYKAFKEAAAHIAGLESVGSRRYPRSVALEPRYAEALPDLVLGVGPQRLLKLALKAFTPKAPPVVSIAHIHMVRVSVREHANIVKDRLFEQREATFSALCIDCESTLEVVARFLALLELYRENLVSFEQAQALGELLVRWTGTDDADVAIEVEEYEGAPAPPAGAAPEGGTPDGATPEGGLPDAVDVAIEVEEYEAPAPPAGAAPEDDAPDGAGPEGSFPGGAAPDGGSPDGAAADDSPSGGAADGGASLLTEPEDPGEAAAANAGEDDEADSEVAQ